jgi:glycogen operon protein
VAPAWACRLPIEIVRGAAYYAYRCDGPGPRESYGRLGFDAEKVLLDPYARAIEFPPGFDRASAARAGSNAGAALLGVLPRFEDGAGTSIGAEGVTGVGSSRPPAPRRESEDIARGLIYELHVRGFTRHESSGVARERQGTYEGVIEKIPYLKSLGVSAVELMPVFQYCPQEGNYWGYMPISFFAVHQQYAARPREAAKEFRAMVDAFHAAGIAVLIDSVQNHTGEGPPGERLSSGQPRFPTYSWRGIDAEAYYMHGHRGLAYSDFSGCGNTFNVRSREGQRLIVESLRYWHEEMGVDGFRHDLAAVCARCEDGALDVEPPILAAIENCRELAGLVHIVEPWDFEGAYLPGAKFPARGARQWNGMFRDDVRRFVRGDASSTVGTLMQRLYGSDDLFPEGRGHGSTAYSPRQSVNYIASHDGFSLYDLTAYTRRRNEANGHDNADGPSDEVSFNCGHEGDDGAPASVIERRVRHAASLVALLLLAAGTPMIRMGDEFLQTQLGNNNPYNQDNATTWLDWTRLERFGAFQRFVRSLAHFRRSHPVLWHARFWRERVSWFGAIGGVDLDPRSRELAYLLRGGGLGGPGAHDLYVMINMGASDRPFAIQSPGRWRVHVNSAALSVDSGENGPFAEESVHVAAKSVVVLAGRAT